MTEMFPLSLMIVYVIEHSLIAINFFFSFFHYHASYYKKMIGYMNTHCELKKKKFTIIIFEGYNHYLLHGSNENTAS